MKVRTKNNSAESTDKHIMSQSLVIPSSKCHIDLDKNKLRHSEQVIDPTTTLNPLSLALPKFLQKYDKYSAREVNAEDTM